MDWRGARLVIFSILLTVSGCYQVDLPKAIWIEESWTAEEETQIRLAIDEWNRFGREYCGEDIINYVGRFADPDGFQSETDPDDSYNTIYKISQPDKYYYFLVKSLGHDLGGYATKSDILIFTFQENVSQNSYSITLHELGHWVGLTHIEDDENAVMYPSAPTGPAVVLTKKDKQAFCIVHGCCVKEP